LCLLGTNQAKDQTRRFTHPASKIDFQLSGTLGTNKVEYGEYYSSSRRTPYMDSKAFLTMISCHFGSIFILFLLPEATSVFTEAHENILIMDVLFF